MLPRTAHLVAALMPHAGEPTDAELMARFAASRDATAFELLVWRHAALVRRTCRGVLRDGHAAEDAAQAVFLALARQAGSVGRSGSVAGWLFRVARRVAVRAARRSVLPTAPDADLNAIPDPGATSAPDPELDRVLHEELARLPDVYRSPILLCFFEGLSHADAARRLGWPVGTVAGRIARAKDVLAARLTRRGVTLSLLTPAGVAVAPSFVTATTRRAVAFAARGEPLVPQPVLDLAQREVRVALARQALGRVVAVVAVCGFLVLGLRSGAEPPPPQQPVTADKAPAPKAPGAIIGKGFAVAPVTTELQRQLLRGAGPDSTALLIVDGPAMFKGATTLDVEALDPAGIRNALKALRPVKGTSVVHFEVHYASIKAPTGPAKEVLDFALHGMARAEGFQPGTAAGLHSYTASSAFPFDFLRHVAPLKDDNGSAEAEAGVGDTRVRAYPVQTPLSRMLTQSVAGVVFVLPALDCRADDWVPEEVNKSVRAALGGLKLVKGGRVNVHLNVSKSDERTQDRVRAACKQWAADAGLELWSFGY